MGLYTLSVQSLPFLIFLKIRDFYYSVCTFTLCLSVLKALIKKNPRRLSGSCPRISCFYMSAMVMLVLLLCEVCEERLRKQQ